MWQSLSKGHFSPQLVFPIGKLEQDKCVWNDYSLYVMSTVSNSVNSVNSVNSYSAVLPPSPMVFFWYWTVLFAKNMPRRRMILIICRKKWQSVPSSFKPRLWYGAFANIAKMNLIICKNKSSKYEPSYFGCGLFILSLTIFHPHQQLRSLSSPFCPPCFTGGHIAAGEPAELAEQHLKIKSRHSAIVSKLLLP